MAFRVAVRAFKHLRSHSPPRFCNRRWYSGSSTDENLKSSVTVGGKNIKYVRVGEGDHTVLCLPGALGSSWTDFKPQLEGLDRKTFTVVAWDPPGYGHSRPPNKEFSKGFLNRDADDAVDFMKALNLPKFSILGWSDGGITGLILAAKYPQNLRKMAIWGANAYVTDEEVEVYKKIRDVSTWSAAMRTPMVELYGEDDFQTMFGQWVDEFVRIQQEDGGNICKEEVKYIKCPLFVLHGKKDPLVYPEHPQYIVDNVPGSQLHIFDEGKHNIHLRYAKEFNELIHKFLTTETSSGIADHRFPVRLPPFWPENPAVWFAQIEAQFHLSDISEDLTKFNCVLAQLDTKYAARVEDVVCNPSSLGKYELLKTELINRLKDDRLRKSLTNAKIGARKPSEFLNHLRKLADNNDSLLRSVWLKGLPKRVRFIVQTVSAPLDSLAELADKISELDHPSKSVDWSSIERRLEIVSKQLNALTESRSRLSRRSTLSSTRVPAAKTRKPSVSPGTNFIRYDIDSLYDVTGLPLPGSPIPKDVLNDVQASSDYHKMLTEFPDLLHPSGVSQELRHQIKHRIATKSGTASSVTPFRLNDGEASITRDVINSMVREGTARPSSSPYGSALRVIRGEIFDASGWHVIGDYRALNYNTVSDSHKIRHPVEISDSLWGCSVFSVVSLRKDWTKIPMAPEDIDKTAVVTLFGQFEFPFMPLGLLNSSRTWQKVLDEILQDLPFCFGYLDGILVFSHTHEEHREHIRSLFHRLSSNGICVNPSTTVFGEPRVDFFNYSVSGSGCSPIPEKTVQALEDMRPPISYADVGRFLRMNNAYRRYVPASMDSPLNALVEQPEVDYSAPVAWTSVLEQAFKDCKSALCRAALHSKPDPYSPMSISVSVGNHAIGAVLNQNHSGLSVPLAFFSKYLTPSQESDSAINRYLLAMYESIKAFRPFVGGRNFTVRTDLSFGVRILGSGRIADSEKFRYAAYCSQFTTDLQYVRPFDNAAARCIAALVEPPSSQSVDPENNSAETSRVVQSSSLF